MNSNDAHDDWIIEQAAQQGFGTNSRESIAVIYSLAGPPIGGFLTSIAEIADFRYGPTLKQLIDSPFTTMSDLMQLIFSLTFGGYIFGGFQAAACGLLLMTMSDHQARFSYLQASVASVVVAVSAAAILVFLFGLDLVSAFFVVAAGPPTSLILRFLFRKRFAPMRRI